jgi:hypothetical protein
MKRLLILFVCVALLVVPAFAQITTYNAPSGKAITALTIKSNVDTTGNIVFNFNNGSSISGSWSYVTTADYFNFVQVKHGSVTVGGLTDENDYVTAGDFYTFITLPGHDFNYYNFTGNKVVMQGGQYQGAYDILARTDAPYSGAISFTLSSDTQVDYGTPELTDLKTLNYNLGKTLIDEGNDGWLSSIMQFAYQVFPEVISFIGELIYWLKFFFIDNLALILALFLSVPMAFAAKNSRGNPERFMRQYFKTLRGFFEFIFQVWRLLTETIGTVIGWFKGFL